MAMYIGTTRVAAAPTTPILEKLSAAAYLQGMKDGSEPITIPFDADLLEGKGKSYYKYNENLLDNTDFDNPVNQRRLTSYTGTTLMYTIDRWYSHLASYNVTTKVAGYVTDDGYGCYLCQYKDQTGLVAGDTVAWSIEINGILKYGTTTLVEAVSPIWQTNHVLEEDWGGVGVFTRANYGVVFLIYFNPGKSAALNHPKLEYGDFVTKWVSKGYATELNNALTYFERIGGPDSPYLAEFGYCAAGATFFQTCIYYHYKRINPTIQLSGPAQYRVLYYNSAGGTLSAGAISQIGANSTYRNYSKLYCYAAACGPACNALLQRSDGASVPWIDIVAELV